jgi:excisionase family DNA binding protein
MSELLTVDEVAERLRVTKHRIWRMVRNGEIPFTRISKRGTRFRAQDIEKWIEDRTEEVHGAAA